MDLLEAKIDKDGHRSLWCRSEKLQGSTDNFIGKQSLKASLYEPLQTPSVAPHLLLVRPDVQLYYWIMRSIHLSCPTTR